MKSNKTIRSQIRKIIITIVLLLSSLIVIAVIWLLTLSSSYNKAVKRIDKANINISILEKKIYEEAYFLATERKDISDENLMNEISKFNDNLKWLNNATSTDSKSYEDLIILNNTYNTLNKYCKTLIYSIQTNDKYDNRMIIVDDIQSVIDTMTFQTNNFIYKELDFISQLNENNLQGSIILMISFAILFIAIIVLIKGYLDYLEQTVINPITNLSKSTLNVAEGDFDSLVPYKGQNELSILENNYNYMIQRIQAFILKEKKDSEQLRMTEFKLLQEQINPHFLYNTLETLIWLIENEKYTDAIKMVELLSSFLRLSLSDGKSIVTLEQEFKHIESYLEIQKFRYSNILQYEFNLPNEFKFVLIPKLTLQPIVENAIYHGLKPKKAPGKIFIGVRSYDQSIIITIMDDGIGIDEDVLEKINIDHFDATGDRTLDKIGIGIINLRSRLTLYFGEKSSVTVISKKGQGTVVKLVIPIEFNK